MKKQPWYRRGLPGWFQFGGGGGGGSFTGVVTDTTLTGNGLVATPLGLKQAFTDASLQGDGTVAVPLGILQVSTDASLQGAGTSGSPLGILKVSTDATLTGAGTTGSPLGAQLTTFYAPLLDNHNVVAGFGFNPNQTILQGVYLPAINTTDITLNITTTDNANNYDVGFYNAAGSRVAHIGAQTLPAGGYQTFAWSGGPFLLAAGLYYFGLTGANNVAQLGYLNTSGWTRGQTITGGVTVGGALLASVVPPANVVVGNSNFAVFALS